MRYLKSASISILIMFALIAIAMGLYYLKQVTTWSLVLVLMLGFLVINFVSSLVIFIQRRNLMAKLSWLLVINILPFAGAMFFYVFGLRYSERREYHAYIDNKFIKQDRNLFMPKIKPENPLLAEIAHMTKRGIYQGDFEFFTSGDQAISQMFHDMRQAKKFIHLHFYIVKPGEIYEEFKDILIKKAQAGVEVRFIIDDFGRWGMPYHQIKELTKAGVEIGVFGKVNFPFIGSENGYRTHRKMVIIDAKIAYSGGLNIANEYVSLNKKYGMWIDLQGKITGAFVKSQSLLFLQDWALVTKKVLEHKLYVQNTQNGNSLSTLVEDSPGNRESILESVLIKLILTAKKEIKIATPYFVPSHHIYFALKAALLSGVVVHLYIPGKPDKKLVYSATKFNVNKLQKFGLIVHEMQNILIHAKVGIFDHQYAYFGTSNIDIRSFYSNFETLNILTGSAVKNLETLFLQYEKMSAVIPLGKYEENFFLEKAMRFFVNLFSPIM